MRIGTVIYFLAVALLASTVFGQYLVEEPKPQNQGQSSVIVFGPSEPTNVGQAIGIGAERVFTVHTDEFLAEMRKFIEDEEKEKALNGRLGRPPVTSSAIALAALATDRRYMIERLESEQAKVQALEAELVTLRYQLRLTLKPEPRPMADTRLKFTMITAVDCSTCPAKLAKVRPWAEKAGYAFEHVSHTSMQMGKEYPHYRLCYGDYCEEFTSPVVSLGDAVAQRLKKWGVAFKTVATAPAKAIRKRWGQFEGHYTPTVVGQTIEYHLTEGHGVDITGMTVEQMEAEHLRQHGQ
jgi:hypothetical protein